MGEECPASCVGRSSETLATWIRGSCDLPTYAPACKCFRELLLCRGFQEYRWRVLFRHPSIRRIAKQLNTIRNNHSRNKVSDSKNVYTVSLKSLTVPEWAPDPKQGTWPILPGALRLNWVFIKGGCSGSGVQRMGVVLYNELVYNII